MEENAFRSELDANKLIAKLEKFAMSKVVARVQRLRGERKMATE